MNLKNTREVISEEEPTSESSEEEEESFDTLPVDGDLLMIKRVLNSQPKDVEESLRENIFHTLC